MPTNPADKMMLGSSLTTCKVTWMMKYFPMLEFMNELEDVKKRTDETIDAPIDCICQLAHCPLIGDGSDAAVESEVQHRLICAIPDGDIELQKELLKVS